MIDLKKHIHDSANGLDYTLVNDHYLPNLTVAAPAEHPIGRWGRLHKMYLKEQHPIRYNQLLLPLSLTELHILKEYGTSDQLETCMALKLLVDRCQISNPYAAINARVAIERLSPKQYLRFFASLESLKV